MRKLRTKLKEYYSNYKFNSLFFKNLYMLLLLILIPLLGTMILGYYSYQSIQNRDISSYCENLVTEIDVKLSRILDEAYSELTYFTTNTNVELFLIDSDLTQEYYQISAIQDLIKMPVIVKDYVSSVFLYSKNNQSVISAHGISSYDTFFQRSIIDGCQSIPKQKKIFLSSAKEWSGSSKSYLSVGYSFSFGTSAQGLAIMNIDRKALVKELEIPENVELCIIKDGIVWLSTENSLLSNSADEITLASKTNNTYLHEVSNGVSDFQYLLKLDLTSYQDQLGHVRLVILLIMLTVTWMAVALSFIISLRLFQPMRRIMDLVQYSHDQAEDENLIIANNELEFILKSIQRSSTSRKILDETLLERTKLLRTAQSVALQAQINPHFLNNTLETVNWTSIELLGKNNLISEIIHALSSMLRLSLESADMLIPISKEIEHCKYYLQIQQLRYEDKFDVVWNIDPAILEYKIVKIVLQPLVENAIYHGIKPLSTKGILTISGHATDDCVFISVKDSGLGMNEMQLQNLKESIKSNSIKENKHIGLSNVNQRLTIFFGEEYGLLIDSSEEMGTKVTLRIPKS